MSSTSKFILGSLVGGAIGCVVGMLLAPRSGVETREMIKTEIDDRYRESSRAISDKANEVKHKAETLAHDVSSRVKTITDELEEVGEKAVQSVSKKLEANS